MATTSDAGGDERVVSVTGSLSAGPPFKGIVATVPLTLIPARLIAPRSTSPAVESGSGTATCRFTEPPRGTRPLTRRTLEPGSRETVSAGGDDESASETRPSILRGVSGGSKDSTTPAGVALARSVAALPFASTEFRGAPYDHGRASTAHPGPYGSRAKSVPSTQSVPSKPRIPDS